MGWWYTVTRELPGGNVEAVEVGPFATRGDARRSIACEGLPYLPTQPYERPEVD